MSDTKTYIGEKAFSLFLQNGYKGTGLTAILKETGLSKGAFYHHFTSKEEVYRHVIEKYFIAYFHKVEWEHLKQLSQSQLDEQIRTFYRGFIREVNQMTNGQSGKYFILFFEAFHLFADFHSRVRELYDQLKGLLKAKHIEAGTPESEANQAAVKIIAQMEGMLFWQAIYPEQSIESLLKTPNGYIS